MPFIKSKKAKQRPTINTSALPDIIFMLLFFFMVVTVLRNSKMMLKVTLPKASESQKIEHRSLVNHLHIGSPLDERMGNSTRIQINDAFVPKHLIGKAIKELTAKKPPALQPLVITSMKIDEGVKMGIINDVKTALRKAEQYKVQYAAQKVRE